MCVYVVYVRAYPHTDIPTYIIPTHTYIPTYPQTPSHIHPPAIMHEGRGRAPSESDPPAAPKGVVQVGSNTRHRIAPGTRTIEVEQLQRSVDLQGVGQRGGARGLDIIPCTTYMHTQHIGERGAGR